MKLQKTFLIFITKLVSGIVPGIFSVIVNYYVINTYGSDTNGLIATVAQFTSILALFEGGFTLSTNIQLYKPFINQDFNKINEIISSANYFYKKIGYFSLIFVIFIGIFLSMQIKTSTSQVNVFVLILISSLNLIFHFLFFARLNLMFYASQTEYKLEIINFIINIFSQLLSIITIIVGAPFLFFKLIQICSQFIKYPFVRYFLNKNFPFINYNLPISKYINFKNTIDVFIQNIASVIFTSFDLIIISIYFNTKYSSYFAVYIFIYSFLKSIFSAIISAPFNAFGHVHADNDKKIKDYFNIYYLFSLIFITVILISTNIVILPFIRIYTFNLHDINYIDKYIAILMSFMIFLEMQLNVFGTILNSGGQFSILKNNSILGVIIYIFLAIFLKSYIGIYCVLVGKIISYLIMYTILNFHINTQQLKDNLNISNKIFIGNFIILILSFLLINLLISNITNYFNFLIYGIITLILSTIVSLIVNYLFLPKLIKQFYEIIVNVYINFSKTIFQK